MGHPERESTIHTGHGTLILAYFISVRRTHVATVTCTPPYHKSLKQYHIVLNSYLSFFRNKQKTHYQVTPIAYSNAKTNDD